MVLAERDVRDRPGDVDPVGRGGRVEGEGGCSERARVEDAAPPALPLTTPEDRVRAALREALDDTDRSVGPEHRRGRGRHEARGEALLGDPRAREPPARRESDEVERRRVVRLLERVRRRGPARGVEREARDAEQGALRCVGDDEHAPAAARADDQADPRPAGLDEHGVLCDAGDPAVDGRQRRDRRSASRRRHGSRASAAGPRSTRRAAIRRARPPARPARPPGRPPPPRPCPARAARARAGG